MPFLTQEDRSSETKMVTFLFRWGHSLKIYVPGTIFHMGGGFTEDVCPGHHTSTPLFILKLSFFWDQYNSSPLHSWGRWSLKTEQAARKLRRPDLEATQLSWMHCLARIRSSVLWVWGRNRIPCFLVLPIRLSLCLTCVFLVCLFWCILLHLWYLHTSLIFSAAPLWPHRRPPC